MRAADPASLSNLGESAALACGFLVVAQATNLAAAERQLAALDTLAGRLAQGRDLDPRAARLPARTERVLIRGAASLVVAKLLAEDPDGLAALELVLCEILLFPYSEAGPRTSCRPGAEGAPRPPGTSRGARLSRGALCRCGRIVPCFSCRP